MPFGNELLYHYTDVESLISILENLTIYPSSSRAAQGKGVYFTTDPPQTDNKKLVKHNWGDAEAAYNMNVDRTQYYVRVSRSELRSHGRLKCGCVNDTEHCVLKARALQLDEVDFRVGERKRYSSKGAYGGERYYKGGVFVPGGGRAPKGGCWM